MIGLQRTTGILLAVMLLIAVLATERVLKTDIFGKGISGLKAVFIVSVLDGFVMGLAVAELLQIMIGG